MQKPDPIVIPLSKSKIVLMLAGAVVFVVLGVFFIIKPESFRNSLFYSPITIVCVGVAAVLFFGFVVIALVKKLRDNTPGIIINNEGIVDNSSAVSAGLVIWDDITGIQIAQVMNQRFIMLILKNPNDYINMHTNILKKKLLSLTIKALDRR